MTARSTARSAGDSSGLAMCPTSVDTVCAAIRTHSAARRILTLRLRDEWAGSIALPAAASRVGSTEDSQAAGFMEAGVGGKTAPSGAKAAVLCTPRLRLG